MKSDTEKILLQFKEDVWRILATVCHALLAIIAALQNPAAKTTSLSQAASAVRSVLVSADLLSDEARQSRDPE
ncbi:MAG: hypothetical protein LAO09_01485 [Acidobacteriia bacterium]|nr:hypothetical protein [Terriglobia bacterium]